MTMRTVIAAAALAAALGSSLARAQTRPLPPVTELQPIPNLNLHLVIPSAVTPELAIVPSDIRGLRDQFNFDVFAWLEFIAVNWPADANSCSIKPTVTLLDDTTSPRIWETWKSGAEIFVPDPATTRPAAWCAQGTPRERMQRTTLDLSPAVVAALTERLEASGVLRVLSNSNRFSGTSALQQAFGGPLVDQNGRFVRYEERVNADEFLFVVGNQLWNKAGQLRWLAQHDSIELPSGKAGGAVGSIEVKAAWKVLTPSELQSRRFYNIKALLITGVDASGRPVTEIADVGLIAFHIAHKTLSAPEWTWATFEHVDNLTSSLHTPTCHNRSSCGSACTLGCCPENCQTTSCTGANCNEFLSDRAINRATQVTRTQDVARMSTPDVDVGRVNTAFQRLLASSVWANYALISTQWPLRPNERDSMPAPPFLANVALETFNQGPTPQGTDGAFPYTDSRYKPFDAGTSSSCLKCHGKATHDFSFLLDRAK